MRDGACGSVLQLDEVLELRGEVHELQRADRVRHVGDEHLLLVRAVHIEILYINYILL